MRDIATKAKALDHRSLQRNAQLDQISLIGPPSIQMKASIASWTTSERAIIEFRPYATTADPQAVSELEQRVSQLAAIFQHAKPSLMYTLSCQGYYINKPNSRFGLIYRSPPGSTDYVCLATLIETKPQPTCSLSTRFEIARRLTIAVAFLHGVGWVHKAIQTRRVLLFTKTTSDPTCIGDAYLTGFQDARGVHRDSTGREADLSWKTKLYRHPDRHSYQDNAYFTTGHDIFALGVVLLELGLWRLFAVDRYEALLKTAKPHEYKLFLITMAGMVDCQMGSLYQSVVKRCLEVDANISEAYRIKLIGNILIDLEQLVGVV
jgi:serine/threonine protein kinase